MTIPVWGALSDRFGRRPVTAVGAVGVALRAFAFFPLIDVGTFWSVTPTGGLAPLIATASLASFDSSAPIALYVALMGVITLVAVALSHETRGLDLRRMSVSDTVREK